MDDTDPATGEFVHWIMWNIPLCTKIIENKAPGIQGKTVEIKMRIPVLVSQTGNTAIILKCML